MPILMGFIMVMIFLNHFNYTINSFAKSILHQHIGCHFFVVVTALQGLDCIIFGETH